MSSSPPDFKDGIPRPETSQSDTGLHLWKYWHNFSHRLRRCELCGEIEAYGPGGWSKVY